jgi:hypothetical protein
MLMRAFETLAIASPIMRFVGTSVMPGLFFQPISLVRIDPVHVARTTTILRDGLTALAALVFKPRPVILPMVLLFRTSVTPGLILGPPGIRRIDIRVQRSND